MSTDKIANYIVDTSYDQIPKDAVNTAKQAILDCIGVTLAGYKESGCSILNEYIREEGGNPQAGVIGWDFKTTASQAAWANGNMAHALDYDDYAICFLGHPTVAILPSALALGEKNKISGKDLLLSYIVGFEVGAKIGPVCLQHYLVGWHTTATLGSVSAVAACAKILGLGADQTKVALGIASSLAGGLKENFGTMTKPFHAGNAARNGVVAALLAQKGFTANTAIMESNQGFCKAFAGGVDLELEKISEGLGERYDIATGITIKPWPACGGTHTTIEGTIYLAEQYNIKPEDVEEIELRTHPAIPTATIHSRPKTGLEGKFSNEYCAARALLDGEVCLKHFTDEQVMQPAVQELIPKVKYNHPEEMSMDMDAALASEVEIRLKNGQSYSHRVNFPKGEARNPLGWEGVSSKFKDCAKVVLSEEQTQKCLDLISDLESVEDISPLMRILTSGQ